MPVSIASQVASKPNLTILQPPNNMVVTPNQPFLVTGAASDRGMPEPIFVDSVTVQVDDGPVIDAVVNEEEYHYTKDEPTVVTFKASAQVTGGQDPHTITVIATNDQNQSVKATVTVFTGEVYEVASPAVLMDVISPFPVGPSAPEIVSLLSEFQQQLIPLSTLLRSVGLVLAGPNLVLSTNPQGAQVLRIGFWIEDPSFPVVAPTPPFRLPRLSEKAASAGFDTVPLLPLLDPSGLIPSFAISIPITTLRHLIDAVRPTIAAGLSQQGIALESLTVYANSPGSVTTSVVGKKYGVSGTVNITEILGTKPLPNVEPEEDVPAVLGMVESESLGGVLGWLYTAIAGFAGVFQVLVVAPGTGEGGLMATLTAGIPSRVPFRNTIIDPSLFPRPDFPMLVPDWKSFGVTDSAVLGTGIATIQARDNTMVALTIGGPADIPGYQVDLAGGVGRIYNFGLVNLVPDRDKFKWQISGAGSNGGSIALAPLDQSGSFEVFFPLPDDVAPGDYSFTLTLNATETCGSDPAKTLTASASKAVRVRVLPNPKVQP